LILFAKKSILFTTNCGQRRLSDNVFDKAIRRTAMYLTAKLPAAEKQIYFGLIVLVLTLCLFSPITSQAAGIPLKTLKAETGPEPQVPKGMQRRVKTPLQLFFMNWPQVPLPSWIRWLRPLRAFF